MNPRVALGHISRRLPRGRGHIGEWIYRHPGSSPVTFTDITGYRRTLGLDDLLSARWFAGERNTGLPMDILRRIHPGDHVVDAGANIGIMSGQMAAATGTAGSVHAFDPLPHNIKQLEQLRDDNGLIQIRVHPYALGAEPATAAIRLAGAGEGAWASFTASWNNGGTLDVEVTTIDAAITDERIAFMKIDVEGYEYDVLSGARRTLAESRPLVYLEVNPQILADAGTSSTEFLQRVEDDFGYIIAPEHQYLVARIDTDLTDLLLQAR